MFVQKHFQEFSGAGPEGPWRIHSILNYVKAEEVELNDGEAESAIMDTHGRRYVDATRRAIRFSLKGEDGLNFTEPALMRVGFNAVNTAIKAAQHYSFAIVRPPGHNAGKHPHNFCYFNNLVIAAERVHRGKQIAIIDFDGHYGNGTHYLIKDKKNYFYASVHSKFSLSPNEERYESENSYLEEVVPVQTDDKVFLALWRNILKEIKRFKPEVLAISAGFDTWYEDPVLGFNIRDYKTYEKLGRMIARLNIPFFGVLEGGFHPQLGRMFYHFAKGLGIIDSQETEISQRYTINEQGEIWEVEVRARMVGKIQERLDEKDWRQLKGKKIEDIEIDKEKKQVILRLDGGKKLVLRLYPKEWEVD